MYARTLTQASARHVVGGTELVNRDGTPWAFLKEISSDGNVSTVDVAPDHLWRIVDAGGGWSKIQNVHSGLVMAVNGASTADNAQITQWTDNGTTDQLWRLV
ncbi:hypothetical protein ABH926_002944 [Catenulispora sp. GP43]